MKKILFIILTALLIIGSLLVGCRDYNNKHLEKIQLLEDELANCKKEIEQRNIQDSITNVEENIRQEKEIVEAAKKKAEKEAKKKAEEAKKKAEEAKKKAEEENVIENEWYTDVNQAINLSVQTKKPLFFFFTGSDWCGWCKRLQKEVFFLPEFKKWANQNVILVELDFPRRTQIAEATLKQNRELAQMFGVRGYPTIWLVNPEITGEKVNFNKLGSQGYVAGGPKAWIVGANKILPPFISSKRVSNFGIPTLNVGNLCILCQSLHCSEKVNM